MHDLLEANYHSHSIYVCGGVVPADRSWEGAYQLWPLGLAAQMLRRDAAVKLDRCPPPRSFQPPPPSPRSFHPPLAPQLPARLAPPLPNRPRSLPASPPLSRAAPLAASRWAAKTAKLLPQLAWGAGPPVEGSWEATIATNHYLAAYTQRPYAVLQR